MENISHFTERTKDLVIQLFHNYEELRNIDDRNDFEGRYQELIHKIVNQILEETSIFSHSQVYDLWDAINLFHKRGISLEHSMALLTILGFRFDR